MVNNILDILHVAEDIHQVSVKQKKSQTDLL